MQLSPGKDIDMTASTRLLALRVAMIATGAMRHQSRTPPEIFM
jgi:hypothetical protein